MIPWRLNFSGIRDYKPTSMDLAPREDHVIIAGPNGAGKSTITFCIGAVLYSSKVDVEGLRSRNLLSDETWRASISLLFKNEGESRVDAAQFIEFRLKIEQEPGGVMRRDFVIASGESEDDLPQLITYRSGDMNYSFTRYRNDLQYKYKIQPDTFYLIWYQQEVNQFAIMSPEERFRIFSEMHGISSIQRDWEESLEHVRDAVEALEVAKTQLGTHKLERNLRKSELDRYLDNRRRLHEHGEAYITSLIGIEAECKKIKNKAEQLKDELHLQRDDHNNLLGEQIGLIEKYTQRTIQFEEEEKRIDEQLEHGETDIQRLQEEIVNLEERISELVDELKLIDEQSKRLIRSEEETLEMLVKSKDEQITMGELLQEVETNLKKEGIEWEQLFKSKSALESEIEHDSETEKRHAQKIKQYESSYAVQLTIENLENDYKMNRDKHANLEDEAHAINDELVMIQNNRYISNRQKDSLLLLKRNGVEGFYFRQLIELQPNATIKDEQRLDAIKYTIFFDGDNFRPPNDLYHVPLKKVIPGRPITELPNLRLKIKEGLSDEMMVFAMKSLWWVEQFFKDQQPAIVHNVLLDERGARGSQEKTSYILSESALMKKKKDLQVKLGEIHKEMEVINHKMKKDSEKFRLLNSEIQKVREAESFITMKHERLLRLEQLENFKVSLKENEKSRHTLAGTRDEYFIKQAEYKIAIEALEQDLELFRQMGKMKKQYEELQTIREQLELKEQAEKQAKDAQKILEEAFERTQSNIRKTKRLKDQCEEEIGKIKRELELIDFQFNRQEEEIKDSDFERTTVIQLLNELSQIIPDIYQKVTSGARHTNLSMRQLKQTRENSSIGFNSARNETGIDPEAQQNYDIVQKEYERREDEFKRTSLLVEQNKERALEIETKLETTVSMNVRKIQQRFQTYMGYFQFEGDISWEKTVDKRDRVIFKLFIKARKEGHRGAMEDVSTKARGGRVGKGVSGGEESLSSLLFALALLQNLDTSPGFIILDEFDSALDEQRKVKVFELYASELERKLIILSPKSHEKAYNDKFSKAFIVKHDPTVPISSVTGIIKRV